MNKNYTFGLLIDWIENPYHLSLLNGIVESSQKHNVNLLSFVGGAINSNRIHEIPRNIIYEYANKRNVDGIIMLTGSIGHFCSSTELEDYIKKFDPLPVISISQSLKNSFSLLVDNKSGLKALINHLIRDHGFKKIAFIGGPDGNQEALLRHEVYRETLAENKIDYDENYIAKGYFIPESGQEAVKLFLDERKLKIDVIVAANDDMAYGAIKELQARNILIPNDIAVTGFDDQLTSQYMMPSLTTVRQNLYQQGYIAVEMLINILKGINVPGVTTLATEPVFRESCGCFTGQKKISVPECTGNETKNFDTKDMFNAIYGEIMNLNDSGLINIPDNEMHDLIYSFLKAVKGTNFELIFNSVQNLLYKYQEISDDSFNNLVSQLDEIKRIFIKHLGDSNAPVISEYINFIKVHILQHIFKRIKYDKIKEDRAVLLFRDVGEEFVAFQTMDEIIEVLVREFSNLEINACYFSLYENQIQDRIDLQTSMSRMLLAYNKKHIELDKNNTLFESMDLIQRNLLKNVDRWSLVVEPLFFGQTQLGVALLDYNPKKGFTFNIMRRMFIFNALKSAIYVQNILTQSHFLEATLNELKETQTKLIQSEKMSALGGLVAGISHEINTPIGVSVTAASYLERLNKEIYDLFFEQKMKKSDFEKFVANSNEASMMILSNLKRAHELISSFKQVAVDQSNEQKRKFNVKEYLNQILLSLKPSLKKTEHIIEIKCREDLEITTFPGAFSQIITNFIMNSLLHAYEKKDKGNMSIEVMAEKNNLVVIYKDDGKGIDPAIIDKIFDPFFTTKRGQGGTGLGLNIVYNIISQTLRGNIRCSSSIGKGTTFTVTFPINS